LNPVLNLSTQGGKSGLQAIPAIPELSQYSLRERILICKLYKYGPVAIPDAAGIIKYTMDLGDGGKWKLYVDGKYSGTADKSRASVSGSSKIYFDKEQTQQVGTVTVQFDST
jgi:hypothetical protein